MKVLTLLADFFVRNLVALAAVGITVMIIFFLFRTKPLILKVLKCVLAAHSVVWIAVLFVLFANNLQFPLFLDLTSKRRSSGKAGGSPFGR